MAQLFCFTHYRFGSIFVKVQTYRRNKVGTPAPAQCHKVKETFINAVGLTAAPAGAFYDETIGFGLRILRRFASRTPGTGVSAIHNGEVRQPRPAGTNHLSCQKSGCHSEPVRTLAWESP